MKQKLHNKSIVRGFYGNRAFLLFAFFWLAPFLLPVVLSQNTFVTGKVLDFKTDLPIPFANIYFLNSHQGTLTGFDGSYSISLQLNKNDSIRASILGYGALTKLVVAGKTQTIDFSLKPKNENLPEVIITYTGNPADAIIDSVVKYKEKNAFQNYRFRQHDTYTRAHIGLNNLPDDIFERKWLEPFDFIENYKDTSALDGKIFTPVMISESKSTVYERNNPYTKKEIIHASRVSGLEHTNVSQYTGNLVMEVDIYQNHIDMFEKNFISPIADRSHDYYKYYLVDSAYIDNKWCYKINYKPRRKQELTFSGDMWVNDTTYAILGISLRIADDANLNFVNDMLIELEYRWTDNRFWMNTRDRVVVDFNILRNSENIIGAYGERVNYHSNFIFDSTGNPKIFKNPSDVTVAPDALKLEDSYWEKVRPEKLTKSESDIYVMVDSVKSSPQFKKYRSLAVGLVSGYFPLGKIEVGSLYKLFSYNTIEGARFRLGLRTTQQLSRKFRIGGYLAYGTLDKRFKYGADFIFLSSKNPRRALNFSYKYDMEQLGLSPTGRPTDNILSSFFSRGPIDKLTMIREYKLSYEYEWYNGLINTVHLNRKELFPPADKKFVLFPESRMDTVYKSSITTTEVGIDARISFKEHILDGKYNRMTVKSEYPVITIRYRYGIPHASVNDYNYHKLNLSIVQWFNLGMIGWSKFFVDAGKIWGTLPYPLLRIHDGNETWLFDEASANMMNYYEFASDQYIHIYYTHHFLGLLFNKIPLLRRLELREVIHARVLWGSLTDENQSFSEFPGALRAFGNEPYVEAGAGLENIIKFFRVDVIWRLTHLNDPGNEPVANFGVFASLHFDF